MRPVPGGAALAIFSLVACLPQLQAQGQPVVPSIQPSLRPEVALLREQGRKYAEAFNARDSKALSDQWTQGAELTEMDAVIRGHDGVMAFIAKSWKKYPESQMKIEVDQVRLLGATTARVSGVIRLHESKSPQSKWFTSRFESLRVNENGVWRIASSSVVPVPDASLSDLAWLVGSWQAKDAATGGTVNAQFEKALGDSLLLVRMTAQIPGSKAVESMQIIQADPEAGFLRCWVFDSTGARAEGAWENEGTTFNAVLFGVAGGANRGRQTRSVQLFTPVGTNGFIWQPVEREVEGGQLPDQSPLHFKRVP